MNREAACRALGVSPRAASSEALAAYKARSRPLKRKLLGAITPEQKQAHRLALRELVSMRDIAIGRNPGPGRRGATLGVSSDTLIRELEHASPDQLDRRGARSFLGVPAKAGAESVREAYSLRSRVLIRRFAAADEETEMNTMRRARAKLREIRNRAL